MAQIQIPLETFEISENPKTIKMTKIRIKTFKMKKIPPKLLK